MKKILLSLTLILIANVGRSQGVKYDSTAIFIMDRMSDVIGDLESCSYKLHTSSDEKNEPYGLVRSYGVDEVYMSGPDKMLVSVEDKKGHRQYMYNGKQMAYYSFTENNYGTIEAPSTTMEAIDKIHNDYDVNFPAADFFYPTFTDDMIALFEEIRYLGMVRIDEKECFHILGKNTEMTVQFWINNDAFTLPAKLLITHSDDHTQYEATFSNWKINTSLPEAMFDFLPPAGANKLRIVAKNSQ
jgi:hypothetical protein